MLTTAFQRTRSFRAEERKRREAAGSGTLALATPAHTPQTTVPEPTHSHPPTRVCLQLERATTQLNRVKTNLRRQFTSMNQAHPDGEV